MCKVDCFCLINGPWHTYAFPSLVSLQRTNTADVLLCVAIWTNNATLELQGNFHWTAKTNVSNSSPLSWENSPQLMSSPCGNLCYCWRSKIWNRSISPGGTRWVGHNFWPECGRAFGLQVFWSIWARLIPFACLSTSHSGLGSQSTRQPFITFSPSPSLCFFFLLKFCQWFCKRQKCLITVLIIVWIWHFFFFNSALKTGLKEKKTISIQNPH